MQRQQKNNPAWYQQPWLWVIIAVLVIGIGGIYISAMGLPHFGSPHSNKSKVTSVKNKNVSNRFNGKTLNKADYKIAINKVYTESEPDDSGKQIIVFDYTVHNKTGKNISADAAWQETFQAFQPTKNVERSLHIGTLDNDDGGEFDRIRKDGTAHAQFAYEIKNPSHPVLLKAYNENGNLIGKHSYILKTKHNNNHGSNNTIFIFSDAPNVNEDNHQPDSDSSSSVSSNKDSSSQDNDNHDDSNWDEDNDNGNNINVPSEQSDVDSTTTNDW